MKYVLNTMCVCVCVSVCGVCVCVSVCECVCEEPQFELSVTSNSKLIVTEGSYQTINLRFFKRS